MILIDMGSCYSRLSKVLPGLAMEMFLLQHMQRYDYYFPLQLSHSHHVHACLHFSSAIPVSICQKHYFSKMLMLISENFWSLVSDNLVSIVVEIIIEEANDMLSTFSPQSSNDSEFGIGNSNIVCQHI